MSNEYKIRLRWVTENLKIGKTQELRKTACACENRADGI